MATATLPPNKIVVSLAIELPYWIPIKSGIYTLQNKHTIWVRNDYWIVSTGNIADDSDPPSDFIVNEEHVTDVTILDNRTRGQAQYLHKRKMNTVFTRTTTDIPTESLLSSNTPTDEWIEQLDKVVIGTIHDESILEEFLEDANLFIDLYSTIISPQNAASEVRQVSFYETMIHLRVNLKTEYFRFENLTRITPDFNMVGQPHPLSRVKDHKILKDFSDTLQSCSPVEFHQLEWIKTLNSRREKRYQDALLHATITLEALAHIYLSATGIESRKNRAHKIKIAGGLADWLIGLKIENLEDECKNIKQLRRLRNDVVHRTKVLAKDDIELVILGIKSLELVRTHLLQTGAPEILELEDRFNSFLEPVHLGITVSENIGQMVSFRFGWRKEKDCYRIVTTPTEEM